MNKREALRSRVYLYYDKNRALGKKMIVDHFVNEGSSKSTIYDILRRFDSGGSVLDKKSSGRPPKIFTNQAKSILKCLFNNKSGVSQRKLARRFNCSQTLVARALESMSIGC